MPSITIDNKEYDIESLSEESKAQLVSLRFVDNELGQLQARVAALQTARIAYGKALKQTLESGTTQEEEGVNIDGLEETLNFDS